MDYEQNERKQESVYSKRLKAGKRRTYFFDVRETRGNDYYLTITESRKRFNDEGYDRHKIFLYKEDFNKFVKALGEAVDYVKTDLMPDYDFDAFNHDYPENQDGYSSDNQSTTTPETPEKQIDEEVKKEKDDVIEEGTTVETTAVSADNTLASEEVEKW
ncbi:DUF3276 family protein [Arachidicoccus soli]|uniref:DUF3276 family protein n=1 Tax=Arachidicoccus soli TaxID=2341117 RepID=A0A386HLQ9_9BACT|nr:DUF3276 family protein [Arachidicoccus soli]AYD46556.1 DUF3276 family protein [Arachidicoccus soli]